MMQEKLMFRPMCSMLLDQGAKIGDDPIGHKCCGIATKVMPFGGNYQLMCDECQLILISHPERLCASPLDGGSTPQEAVDIAKKKQAGVIELMGMK